MCYNRVIWRQNVELLILHTLLIYKVFFESALERGFMDI